ncbi:efflux RND transporter periplasmic adaptor subunit [Psychroserpens sp.]|uniref:efflux RND transporter periplasmic adaptor subunit n=1 Tax=Psychroserpens sp. TaxID=2020870 RepID=UPI001B1EAF77|nr:efflux RND transporter periplasmic adaptor subunit [Psychroserpens sp.]MBO6607853.1 efflux RND transporter periplasmic adaptor subunit [Psychroserpens sp.]MBO6631197.1 efflux RND transporter periplasmic adaptor subunit [Psychroserpens sp.]MBO6654844.1 efflux RND transporter periplasmic adaptor subunit [Psychroserpens sp.]MBO6682732.1 efflux RND transporter periplasmic adaptor subunit [Psychroserpens sp.]MBO6751211.1 efflux RND transporter periplasmic adaptor subunit [Psychroserpens sp.]
MTKKTKIILGVVVLLLVLLVAASKMGLFGKQGNFKQVDTEEVATVDIIETVSATGKIYPEVEVSISSEVSGEILDLPFKEGQQVKKGDLLVRVNPDLIQSALNRTQATYQNVRAGLEQAEATLKQAKADYDRNKTLFDKGVISKADWDRAVAAYETAEASKNSAFYNVRSAAASVNEANDNLERTTIYAPMDGTISLLSVELGERVVGTQQMAGTEILRVADLKNMEVEVDVNENDIVKVQIGDSTIVEVDAYLKKEFKGVVTEIANSAAGTLTADQVTNFKVKVRILEESYKDLLEGKPDSYSPFRPGMTATVDIITDRRASTVAVPISSIVIKTDTSSVRKGFKRSDTADAKPENEEKFECVFINDNGTAKLKVVETGIQDDTNIEVITGLSGGEEIITGPYNLVSKTLKSGDKIEKRKKSTGASEDGEASED